MGLRSKLIKYQKEVREQEMFFIWEKSIPSRKNGKCRNHSETGGCLLHSKSRKKAKVAEVEYGKGKVGNEVKGNRMPNW